MAPGPVLPISDSISFPIPFLRKCGLGVRFLVSFQFHFPICFLENGTRVTSIPFHFDAMHMQFICNATDEIYKFDLPNINISHCKFLFRVHCISHSLSPSKWFPMQQVPVSFPFHFWFRFLKDNHASGGLGECNIHIFCQFYFESSSYNLFPKILTARHCFKYFKVK